MSEMQDKVSARNMRISQKLDLLERQSMQLGAKAERERIIEAWDLEMDCDCDNAFLHMRSRIEGEQK